jgi:hypothetical protein
MRLIRGWAFRTLLVERPTLRWFAAIGTQRRSASKFEIADRRFLRISASNYRFSKIDFRWCRCIHKAQAANSFPRKTLVACTVKRPRGSLRAVSLEGG